MIPTHGETTELESGTFPVYARDVKVCEVFEADEASEALTAFGDPAVRVKRVEGVAVFVGKADSVIVDLETYNVRQAAIELGLAIPQCTD